MKKRKKRNGLSIRCCRVLCTYPLAPLSLLPEHLPRKQELLRDLSGTPAHLFLTWWKLPPKIWVHFQVCLCPIIQLNTKKVIFYQNYVEKKQKPWKRQIARKTWPKEKRLKFRGDFESSRKLLLSHCLTSLKSCSILKLTEDIVRCGYRHEELSWKSRRNPCGF